MRTLGPYRIEGEIARGGFGAVFRARLEGDGEPVALKVLLGPSEKERKRFLREGLALKKVRHPHVVRVLDVGEADGHSYLALSLVQGESLAERLRRRGTLAPMEAVEMAATLGDALECVHLAGILHRDLKPANVLLAADTGAPCLTDFGLAKDLEGRQSKLSQTGAAMGTPGYWPPEQARGDLNTLGPASDVYGLGAVLYAMLTGVPPVQGHSLVEMLVATLEKPIAPPSTLSPGVDRRLDAICMRCLAKNPGDRYASAADLSSALRSYLSRAPRSRPAGWTRARSALALSLGGLALLGGALVLGRASVPTPAKPSAAQVEPPKSPADPLVEEAEALVLESKLDEALALVGRAILLDPKHSLAHSLRGALRQEAGDLAGARADHDAAVSLAPEAPEPYVSRALFRSKALGEPERALEDYERAIELDPTNGLAHLNRGAVLLKLKRPRDALAALDGALAHCTKVAAVYMNRSLAYRRLGDLEAAEAELTTLVRLLPTEAEPLRRRAKVRRLGGQFRGAGADLNAALRLAPADPELWVERGNLEMGAGMFKAALTSALQARSLKPNLNRASYLEGKALLYLGRLDEAEAAFARPTSFRSAQKRAHSYLRRAMTRALAGRREGALSLLGRAVDLDPKQPHWALWLAGLGGDAAPLARHRADSTWLGELTRCLLDRASPGPLLDRLRRKRRRAEETMALGYLGVFAELRGDLVAARDHYQRAIGAGGDQTMQFDWATVRSRQLRQQGGD
jgi:tetratricopeptide (TPR) repeat protein